MKIVLGGLVTSEVQATLIKPNLIWEKKVRCEKDLEAFIILFLKTEAPRHNATAVLILKVLKDKGVIHEDYKTLSKKEEKARRAIGRKLANIVGFECTKKYDPKTKQDRNFWRYGTD